MHRQDDVEGEVPALARCAHALTLTYQSRGKTLACLSTVCNGAFDSVRIAPSRSGPAREVTVAQQPTELPDATLCSFDPSAFGKRKEVFNSSISCPIVRTET